MIKKFNIYILVFLIISLMLASCFITNKTAHISETEKCLIISPLDYDNVRFNPKWISANGIKTIIDREYLDGKNGRIHLVTVEYYDSDGYIHTKYSGKGYPKDDSPNEKDIFSKWDYKIVHKDSFDFLTYHVIRFNDGKNDLEIPDTLSITRRFFNVKHAKFLKNDEGEILGTYRYDNRGRLIEELNEEGISIKKIKYKSDTLIEIEEFFTWFNKTEYSWLTLNKKGQIIRNYDESNENTTEFKYNSIGEMIEAKSWFKNKKPIYHKYEYVK